MSSSKYANLPDIDTAPDVYETEDVPEVGSRRGPLDDDLDDPQNPSSPVLNPRKLDDGSNGFIDESSLPGIDSLVKRFGALASQTYTLYPSSLPFIRPNLPASSVPSDDAAYHTHEHPRARIRRLRYEMEELEKELAEEAAQPPSTGDASETNKPTHDGQGDIMKELNDLKGRLVLVGGEVQRDNGGWESKLKQLGGQRTNGEQAVGTEDHAAAPGWGAVSLVGEDAKVAEIDKRLAELEGMIGVGNSGVDISDPLPTPLLPTLQKLDHLLTLLTQPRHLDAISRRVKLLLIDLDRANPTSSTSTSAASKRRSLTSSSALADPSTPSPSSTSSSLTFQQSERLQSLFALLPRLQPLLPLVPHLLTRLRSLSALHASAAEFGGTLGQVERESVGLREGEKEMRGVLERLEESLKGNEGKMEGNLRALGGRVEEVMRRLEVVQGGQ